MERLIKEQSSEIFEISKKFRHFLITRFNIVQEWYGTIDKKGTMIQTDDWLEKRFRLFETYCMPSVVNQSCKDFTWFVVFNTETPLHFKEKIIEYQENMSFFTPLYLNPFGSLNDLIQFNIRGGGTEYIITTRLDNDDAIHKDFIKVIQDNFRECEDLFLNYPNGYQYDIEKRILSSYFAQNNHYCSKIENSKNAKSVITVNHTKIYEYAQVENIEIFPLWVEIIHSNNKTNSFHRNYIYNTIINHIEEIEKAFNIPIKVSYYSFFYTKFIICKVKIKQLIEKIIRYK